MTDLDQFAVFMRNYQDMVYTTAARLVGNPADAEDIAQEVFLKAHQRFPAFEGIQHVGGWLRRVATNLSLNHLSRYRARWRFFSELQAEDDQEDFAARLAAPEPEPQTLGEADRRALVEEALRKLTSAQRVPLVLYHFEGLSYEEIAVRLGVSLSKVKTDIHRARTTLRRKLQTRLGRELGVSPEGEAGPNPGRPTST
jgi:RNA polymerase sigma-70 factor, ECF subfamily